MRVVGAEIGEGEVLQEGAVVNRPTMEIIQIQETRQIRPTPTRTKILKIIKKDQNIQTYLPVLGGPVLSTGRKAEVLHTARTLLSVNGSGSSLLVNLPLPMPTEILASLVSYIIQKI